LNNGLKEEVFYYRHGLRSMPNMRGRKVNMLRRVGAVNYGSTGGNWRGLSQRDRFAVRWSGVLVIKKAGRYHLSLTSDDGSKMWFDNRYVINNDGLHGMRYKGTNQNAVTGQHWLRIEFLRMVEVLVACSDIVDPILETASAMQVEVL